MSKVTRPPRPKPDKSLQPPFWIFFRPEGTIAEKDGVYWKVEWVYDYDSAYKIWVRISKTKYQVLLDTYYKGKKHHV